MSPAGQIDRAIEPQPGAEAEDLEASKPTEPVRAAEARRPPRSLSGEPDHVSLRGPTAKVAAALLAVAAVAGLAGSAAGLPMPGFAGDSAGGCAGRDRGRRGGAGPARRRHAGRALQGPVPPGDRRRDRLRGVRARSSARPAAGAGTRGRTSSPSRDAARLGPGRRRGRRRSREQPLRRGPGQLRGGLQPARRPQLRVPAPAEAGARQEGRQGRRRGNRWARSGAPARATDPTSTSRSETEARPSGPRPRPSIRCRRRASGRRSPFPLKADAGSAT